MSEGKDKFDELFYSFALVLSSSLLQVHVLLLHMNNNKCISIHDR